MRFCLPGARACAVRTATVLAFCGLPSSSAAQEARVYVGGAAMLSTQAAHRQGSAPSLPTTGAGGTTVGVAAEAGRFLAPHLALGVEFSLPARYTALQETDYTRVFQQESRHRDLVISGVVKGMIGPPGGMRLALVGGGGLVQESTHRRRRDQAGPLPVFPPVFGPYSDEQTFTRWTPAALAGVDLEIPVAAHVTLVPQMRVHFVRRSGDPSQPGWALGLDTMVLRPAVGVRATF